MRTRLPTRAHIARVLAGGLLLSSVVACGGDDDDTAAPRPDETTTSEDSTTTSGDAELSGFSTEWEVFEVPGQFTVELPGDPEQQRQETTTAAGPVTVEFYQVLRDDGGVTLAVTPIGPLPDEAIEPTLAGSVAGAATNIGGTVVSDEPNGTDGYAARDAEITATSGGQSLVMFLRVGFQGERLLQLQSLGLAEDRDAVLADFTRLVDTFTLLEG